MLRKPQPRRRPSQEETEIQRLGKVMERARRSRHRAQLEAQRIYQEMKRRDPEFWKSFGFETEADYLRHYDLTDLIT